MRKNIAAFSNMNMQQQGNANAVRQVTNNCPNCGETNATEATFCKSCGSKLSPVAVPVHRQQNGEQKVVEMVQTKPQNGEKNVQRI